MLKVYDYPKLQGTHRITVGMVDNESRVLEVGCATGFMTRHLRDEQKCRVSAIEINPESAESARPYAEQIIVGSAEDPKVWEEVDGTFDCAIFADVLEHFSDPMEALCKTRAVLSPNGYVIASIPNVAYYKIRKQLLLGKFDYTKAGIMDSTHLRFFTEKTMRQMFGEAGFEVAQLVRTFRAKTDQRLWRLCPNAFTYQFVVKALISP